MWQTLSIEDTIKKLKTNIELGLNYEQIKIRKEKFGENKLTNNKKESLFIKFIKQFNDFMIIILIIASGISALISYLQQTNEYIDSIIIVAIVILNAVMGTFQENKAEKALEELKKMTAPTTKVKRNGNIENIESSELVPGDYVFLENGCYIPADVRLVKTYNFKVEESSLTGETVPVLKDSSVILNKDIADADCKNLAFWSTIVVSGHAEAIITETGMNTKVGKIAAMIIENKSPETPLQIKLRRGRKKIRINSTCNLCCYFFYWASKKNRTNKNVYDCCRTCCCSNTRRIACNNYDNAFYRSYKNVKEKCNNKKITGSRNFG